MKSFFNKLIIIIMFLFAAYMHADIFNLGDCGCPSWDVAAKVGVAPIVWAERGCFTGVLCSISPQSCSTAEFNEFMCVGKFHDYFRQAPWTIGVEAGSFICGCTRAYIDFQYRQTHGKCFSLGLPALVGTANTLLKFSAYRSESFYIGSDYFIDEVWCENISLFIGGKIGLTHFNRTKLSGTVTYAGNPNIFIPSEPVCVYYKGQTVLSAGGRVGVDIGMYDDLSLFITVEFLGQGGRDFDQKDIVLTTCVSDFRFGRIGAEVVFPIEVGVRYSF